MKTELKGALKKIIFRMKGINISPRILFIFTGLISTIWFLVRVIPKPSRATYPCMKVSAPLMSGFVIYLISLGGLSLALKKMWKNLSNAKYVAAISLSILAIGLLAINLSSDTSLLYAQDNLKSPIDEPNKPIGKPAGINPGRVVWAWNPDATNENCKNSIENNDWYFNPLNADQKIISDMFSESIKKIGGNSDLKKSWDDIFRFHNVRKKNMDKAYTNGEKIFIKINQGTARWVLNKSDKDNGYFFPGSLKPGEERRISNFAACETPPYIVLELLRELVNVYGINQADIAIGDPMTPTYGHNYTAWHNEFPNVIFIDKLSEMHGRTVIKPTENDLVFYSDKSQSDKLYNVVEEADYLINCANLKPHGHAGISLTAKNHFGTQAREGAAHLHYSLTAPRTKGNPTNGGYNKYRVQVDIMGSRYLGQNTLLYIVDGLFGGGSDETKVPVKYFMAPFNADWSNSIFISQDQVALESVCYDFLRTEWNGINKHNPANNVSEASPNMYGVEDYLHQAADSGNWPVGIVYDPDNSGKPLASLGVHEHWNNPVDKQYSGNLGTKGGISLISIPETIVKTKNK